MHEEPVEEPKWPREITICPTDETARRSVSEDYDPDNEGGDALLVEKGQLMETIEIESWEDLHLPDGYELWDQDDREEYAEYLNKKGGD